MSYPFTTILSHVSLNFQMRDGYCAIPHQGQELLLVGCSLKCRLFCTFIFPKCEKQSWHSIARAIKRLTSWQIPRTLLWTLRAYSKQQVELMWFSNNVSLRNHKIYLFLNLYNLWCRTKALMILNQTSIPCATTRSHHKGYEDHIHRHISYDDAYELKPIQLDDLTQQVFRRKPGSIQAILELQNSYGSIICGKMQWFQASRTSNLNQTRQVLLDRRKMELLMTSNGLIQSAWQRSSLSYSFRSNF